MSAQAANVVSLDDFRYARNVLQPSRPKTAPGATPDVVPMAWVPVWFMPVYWIGTPLALN